MDPPSLMDLVISCLAKPNYKSLVVNNELGGNQDESVEQSSKFLVNISGYYMKVDDYQTLNELRFAIVERIEQGVKFRELLVARLSELDQDMNTALPQDGRQFVEDLKPKIKELATLLDTAIVPLPSYGGRRNFRRYSRRKRR